MRLFDQNGTRCRIVAELWSFENIKSFVQEEVGLAIVPGVTVRQELRDGTLVRIPLRELNVPRRTLMIYREQGYVSDTARELIKIVRAFNWDQGFNDKQQNRAPIAALEPTELRNRIRRGQGRLESFSVKVPYQQEIKRPGGIENPPGLLTFRSPVPDLSVLPHHHSPLDVIELWKSPQEERISLREDRVLLAAADAAASLFAIVRI